MSAANAVRSLSGVHRRAAVHAANELRQFLNFSQIVKDRAGSFTTGSFTTESSMNGGPASFDVETSLSTEQSMASASSIRSKAGEQTTPQLRSIGREGSAPFPRMGSLEVLPLQTDRGDLNLICVDSI